MHQTLNATCCFLTSAPPAAAKPVPDVSNVGAGLTFLAEIDNVLLLDLSLADYASFAWFHNCLGTCLTDDMSADGFFAPLSPSRLL